MTDANIAPRVGIAVADCLLGRHVKRRPGDRPFLGELRFSDIDERLGQPKIEQLGHIESAAANRSKESRLTTAVSPDEPRLVTDGKREIGAVEELFRAARKRQIGNAQHVLNRCRVMD